nr:hypothetical protein [Tanacetum cinerariifolium]
PPKVLIVPNPEPFNNQTIDELPQTLPSFVLTCYSKDGNSFTYDSKSNLVYDSPNVFHPPSQPPLYSCKFYGNDAHIPKEIYSNPLFDEEIISIKIDPHHFNAESDLIESLLTHDSLIFSSSLNIDSLFDEFASELTLLKSIPPGINETDYDPEEETRLIKRLLYDNSSPLEDSDSFMEEIDLSFTPDNPMPLGIEKDD